MEFEVIRKLHDQGGSLLVSLPILWVRSKKLKAGDRVVMHFDDKITIEAGRREEAR
jgi:antitoxin component of MazEF toxin-antitoxin module